VHARWFYCINQEALAEGEIVTATVEAISSEEHQLREAALTVLSCWTSNAKPLLQVSSFIANAMQFVAAAGRRHGMAP
jgi:hypothetical protein